MTGLALTALLGFPQDAPTEGQVRRWLEGLRHEDPSVRLDARHRLIQHGCVKEVEPLRASADADVRALAKEILSVVAFADRLKLKPLWKREAALVERLALAPHEDWPAALSGHLRSRPESLVREDEVAIADELIRHPKALDGHWAAVFQSGAA